MGPRQEIRIESINRLHVQSGVRDVQEPQIRRHVLENGHLVALGIPHLLVYTAFLANKSRYLMIFLFETAILINLSAFSYLFSGSLQMNAKRSVHPEVYPEFW